MEMTTREVWTLVHGMGFGGLYLLACSGVLVELWRRYSPDATAIVTERDEAFLRVYVALMAVVAWAAVLTGAYVIYPWYRAAPPAGGADLVMFPQRLLQSSAATSEWHSIGMEWKEHVAWLVPMATTMAAAVFFRYGRNLREHRELRNGVLGFMLTALVAAGVAGFFGAMLNKHAPVGGGQTIVLERESK